MPKSCNILSNTEATFDKNYYITIGIINTIIRVHAHRINAEYH